MSPVFPGRHDGLKENMMSHVNGRTVVLDLEALRLLCAQSISAIDEQQDAVLQVALRKVCENCSAAKGHLSAPQALRVA